MKRPLIASQEARWDLWRVIHEGSVRVRLIFAWYDFWVGVYVDRSAPAVYIFPIPMVGIRIDWPGLPDFYLRRAPVRSGVEGPGR